MLLPCHTVHGVLKARILKWFAIPFSSGPHFVRTLHHDPSILSGPTRMAHSFIELDKAVVHVIRLVGFLWLWFSFCLPSAGEEEGFPGGSDSKESTCSAGDLGSIPGLGRSRAEGNCNPLQYSCLENSMDGGSWWATVHGVTISWTWLEENTFVLSL